MNRLVLGVLLGLAFGAADVALSLPDKRTALAAAFLDGFAIGFLSAQVGMLFRIGQEEPSSGSW